MLICICGKEASFHCTSCNPKVNLCLTCIAGHLTQNTEDCIKPLKLKQSGANICGICNVEKAVKLGVSDLGSEKVCKTCKLKFDVFIDLKWSNVISKLSDIENLSIRQSALSQLNKELDQAQLYSVAAGTLNNYKHDIYQIIDFIFAEKQKEITQQSSMNNKIITKIKKEASEQILQKEFDLSTEGGQLLNKKIQGKPIDISHLNPTLILPDPQSLHSMINSFLSKIVISENKPEEKSVFLFTPGKNVLVKISLGELQKTEFVFDKIWNFEASWIQLDSGDLLICGGNGRDSSEVLQINIKSKSIRALPSFRGSAGHSLVQVGKSVYAFGGTKEFISEKFLVNDEKWVNITPSPVKIQRASTCILNERILLTGGETDKIYSYDYEKDTYGTFEFNLDGFFVKNKIIFVHEDKLLCLAGDKIFVNRVGNKSKLEEFNVNDRDWWTYSAPVIHNRCAYFIKYFVRNLWRLDLDTMKLSEITISSIS